MKYPALHAIIALALASCASNTRLTSTAPIVASIATPKMEQHMRFITPGVAITTINSPIGGLIAEPGSGPKGEMRAFFSAELTRCVTEELNKTMKVCIGSGGTATLETNVTQWGYWGRPMKLDGYLIPVAVMHFKLVDAQGHTLASYRTPGANQHSGVAYTDAPVRHMDELKGNIPNLREGLAWLARRTARDLAAGL